MRLLNVDTMAFELFLDETKMPPYTILSHCWGDEEVSFKDLQGGNYRHLKGFKKIESCCRRTSFELLNYTWIDTCCIDKESSAELSEAINSMFRWYERAAVCYAYLEDVEWDWAENTWLDKGAEHVAITLDIPREAPETAEPGIAVSRISMYDNIIHNVTMTGPKKVSNPGLIRKMFSGKQPKYSIKDEKAARFKTDQVLAPRYYDELSSVHVLAHRLGSPNVAKLRESGWFTRGWTLQELIAPDHVVFFDHQWREIGSKIMLSSIISSITGIDRLVLCHSYLKRRGVVATRMSLQERLRCFSVATRMYWASNRSTSRIEDIAYCLLGIFDINMPLLYGEGDRAFYRLQQEIMLEGTDPTILLFRGHRRGRSKLLAPSPAFFSPEFSEPSYNGLNSDMKEDAKLTLDVAKTTISIEAMTFDFGALLGLNSLELYKASSKDLAHILPPCIAEMSMYQTDMLKSAVVAILTRSRGEAIALLLIPEDGNPEPTTIWSKVCTHVFRFQYDIASNETPKARTLKLKLMKPTTAPTERKIARNSLMDIPNHYIATRLPDDYLEPLHIKTWAPDFDWPIIMGMADVFIFSSNDDEAHPPFSVIEFPHADRVACRTLPWRSNSDDYSVDEQDKLLRMMCESQRHIESTSIGLAPGLFLSVSTRFSHDDRRTLFVTMEQEGHEPHEYRVVKHDINELVQLRWGKQMMDWFDPCMVLNHPHFQG